MNRCVLGILLCCLWGMGLRAQSTVYGLPYGQGFESGLGDWSVIDYNNDGHTWSTTSGGGVPGAGGSTGFASSSSYAGGVDFAPDDFLISPRIAVDSPAVLTWWHRVANAAYPADHYSVYISTTGGTVADFLATTPVFSVTPTDLEYGIWLKQTVDLSAYVGDTISVAFRHHDCYGSSHPQRGIEFLGYTKERTDTQELGENDIIYKYRRDKYQYVFHILSVFMLLLRLSL